MTRNLIGSRRSFEQVLWIKFLEFKFGIFQIWLEQRIDRILAIGCKEFGFQALETVHRPVLQFGAAKLRTQ